MGQTHIHTHREYRWKKQTDFLTAGEFYSDYFMQACLTLLPCMWTLSALLTQSSESDLHCVCVGKCHIKDDEKRKSKRIMWWRPCVWRSAALDNGQMNLLGSHWPTESNPPPGKHSPSPGEGGSKSAPLHTQNTFKRMERKKEKDRKKEKKDRQTDRHSYINIIVTLANSRCCNNYICMRF